VSVSPNLRLDWQWCGQVHELMGGSNFWGKSYGTFMGEYLISMFPDRVGRVIIDGVGDPRRWANTPNYQLSSGWFGNAEDTLKGFFDACAEVCWMTSLHQ
jgi:pimeloyl-ACP methyl ester carboxylesterase